jgi:hypothetical protein
LKKWTKSAIFCGHFYFQKWAKMGKNGHFGHFFSENFRTVFKKVAFLPKKVAICPLFAHFFLKNGHSKTA